MSSEARKLVVKHASRSPNRPTGQPLRALRIDCSCGRNTFQLGVADVGGACESCGSHLVACCVSCLGLTCLGCIEKAVVENGKQNTPNVDLSNLSS
jgi:hypothetical protein